MSDSGKTVGVEVHYMDEGYHALLHNDKRTLYLFTDEQGHHEVDAIDVTRHLVTEWLDTTGREDAELLEDIYSLFQNGISEITGRASASEALRVRSMMVGDIIALQTNNRGPKRQYVVADIGFERIG